MKRIRKSRAARVLSWLVTVAMLAPMVFDVVRPSMAAAQAATQTSNLQTVIVVDFANTSKVLGDALARRATDAVAVELGNSGRFEVLRRDEIDRQAQDLGLKKPYDTIALGKLSNALAASAYVTGEIVAVRQSPKNAPKSISVGLRVRVCEGSSGDLINGASQVGEARGRPGVMDDESLVQEAVDAASVLAVKQILATTLPAGTIISTVGTGKTGEALQILVNRGSRDGVGEGMKMIVLRDGQRVGRLVVTNVFPADAEARAEENTLGINPGDKVRAIFPMPAFPKSMGVRGEKSPTGSTSASMSSLGKMLVVLLFGGLVAAAVAGGKNTSVTGVIAEPMVKSGSPAVRVAWRDNMWGGTTLEHQVWRSPDQIYNFQGNPVGAVTSGSEFFDVPAPGSFWDGVRGFLQPPTPDSTNGNNSGGNNATVVTPELGAVPGFTVGTSYTYQVTGVIRVPVATANTGGTNGGGNTDTGTNDVGTSPVSSGQATPIYPPLLGPTPTDQATNIDITQFMPQWTSRVGADVFVVEVTTDRSFLNRNLILQLPILYSTAPNTDGVAQQIAAALDLRSSAPLLRDTVFANFVSGASTVKPTIYWRVGGRNDSDRPGPVDWMTGQKGTADRTFRWVYSSVRSFKPADLPPPPP